MQDRNVLLGLHLIIHATFYIWQLVWDNINLLPRIKVHFAFTFVTISYVIYQSFYLQPNPFAIRVVYITFVFYHLFTYYVLKLLHACLILMTSSFPRVTGYIFSKAQNWLSTIINKYYFEYLLSESIPWIWSLLSHTDARGKNTHVEPLVNPFSRCFKRYFNSCFCLSYGY